MSEFSCEKNLMAFNSCFFLDKATFSLPRPLWHTHTNTLAYTRSHTLHIVLAIAIDSTTEPGPIGLWQIVRKILSSQIFSDDLMNRTLSVIRAAKPRARETFRQFFHPCKKLFNCLSLLVSLPLSLSSSLSHTRTHTHTHSPTHAHTHTRTRYELG